MKLGFRFRIHVALSAVALCLVATSVVAYLNMRALSKTSELLAASDRFNKLPSTDAKTVQSIGRLRARALSTQETQKWTLALLLLVGAGAFLFATVAVERAGRPLSEILSQLDGLGGDKLPALPGPTAAGLGEFGRAFSKIVTRLKEDEALAATLQEKLLPRFKPALPGIVVHAAQRQAHLVGGDWYDYHVLDGLLAFTIADSSGKGMAGALLSTVAMTALRSQPKTRTNIRQVLRQVNLAVESRLGGESFVTLITGFVDPKTGWAEIINCGHEKPLVYRMTEKAWSFLDCPSTLPLGISYDHFQPRIEHIQLGPGDRLLLYTDGLHDVRGDNKPLLSMDKIVSWLEIMKDYELEELIEALLARTVNYAQGDIRDDITLMGIEFTSGMLGPQQ